MDIYFVSDFHLGHFNIIRYTNRPFSALEEMDSVIIRKFNERVKEDDLVFFLGDFCMKTSSEAKEAPKNAFEYYRSQLICKNIIFIRGNHDNNNSTKTPIESIVINHGGERIYLTHNPKYAKKDFHLNFCGHVHDKWKFQKIDRNSYIVNLSVENWDYYPITFNEINQHFSIWRKSGEK